MKNLLGHRWGFVLRLSALALLLATLAVPFGSAARRASAAPASPPPLDLAAMTLMPEDWQAAGLDLIGLDYTDGATKWINPSAIASGSVPGSHATQADVGQLLFKVQALGGVRAYQSEQDQLDAPGSTTISLEIITQTAQFADEQSADQMLTLITPVNANPTVITQETGAPQIGDRSVALRDHVIIGQGTPPRLYVAFRDKNILGVVEAIGTVGGGEPELNLGVTLANRLLARMKAVQTTTAPLSKLALHLGGINYSPVLDGYVRLDHSTIPYSGQTANDPGMTSRNQLYGDSVEVYGLGEKLPTTTDATASTTYTLRIMRFADTATAAKWIKETPQATVDSTKTSATSAGDTYQAKLVNLGKQIGDASQIYSYTEQSSTTTWHGYQAYFQVGADTVQLVFEAGFEVQPDFVETLASAQATCLKQGSCDKALTLPDKLMDTICPINPEGGEATGPVKGTVAMPGADPARTGVLPGPAPAGQPQVAWRIAENSMDQAAPMVANGVAYFPLESSMTLPAPFNPNVPEVVAVDAATGMRKWCNIGIGSFNSALAIAGDLVIVPEADSLVALDAATGTERWHFDTGGDESDVAVVNGILYAGSYDGGLLALDAKSGKAQWRFQAPEPENPSDTPVTMYTPAVADGVVYAATQRRMYALDAASGKQLWHYAPSDTAPTFSLSPAVADGIVVIGLGDDLLALDAKNGTVRWQITPKGAVGGAPTIVDGVVYASTGLQNDEVDGDASLDAFSAQDGSVLWTIPVKGFAQAQPAFVDGTVYFTSGVRGTDEVTSTITAVDAKTGKTEWTFPLDGPPSSPVVVGGMIYVGTGYPGTGTGNTDKTGAIYAIGGAEQAAPATHQPRSQQSDRS